MAINSEACERGLPFRSIPLHAVRVHWTLDVLECEVAQIFERRFQSADNGVTHVTRDYDATRRRLGLQAGSYVHAISVKIVSFHDKVAEMQPDAKHDPGVLGLIPIGLGHGLLEFNRR